MAGGGVAGLVTALLCARRGHTCALFDAGPASAHRCSRHAGGMLAPLSELDIVEPVLTRLGLDAAEEWSVLLGDDARGDLFDAQGSLLVAHRPEWPLLRQLLQRIHSAGLAERAEAVGEQRIAQLEPWLAGRMRRGVWIASEGVVHPERLLPALHARIDAAGVIVHSDTEIAEVRPGQLVTRDGQVYAADQVIDCRGLGARPDLPLRGVRGEYLLVRSRALQPTRPIRLMHPRYPLYVVPRPDGQLYIGATQLESEHGGPMQVRSALELLSGLYSLNPGFADAEIERLGVGLRPAFTNNLPQIRVEAGLISINGLFRHGFLLAPRLGQWVADILDARALPDESATFVHRATGTS